MPPSTSEAPAATVQCLVRPGRFSSVIIGSFQCVPPPTHARRPSRLWLNNFDPLMAGDCWPLEVMLNSTHESILSFIHVWCDRSFMNRAAKTCLLALHVLAGRPDFTYIHWTYEIDSRNPTFWNIWPRIILYLTGLKLYMYSRRTLRGPHAWYPVIWYSVNPLLCTTMMKIPEICQSGLFCMI